MWTATCALWPAAGQHERINDRVKSLVRRAIIPLAGVAELADAQDLRIARLPDHTRSPVDFSNKFARRLEIVRHFEGPFRHAVARDWPAGRITPPFAR